jgi:hypothetical protein
MSGRRPRCRRGRRASALHSTQGGRGRHRLGIRHNAGSSSAQWPRSARRSSGKGNVNQGLENRTSMVRIDGRKDESMSCVCHDCD